MHRGDMPSGHSYVNGDIHEMNLFPKDREKKNTKTEGWRTGKGGRAQLTQEKRKHVGKRPRCVVHDVELAGLE